MRRHGIVIGGSAGAGKGLAVILGELPSGFLLPVLVVLHLHPDDNGAFARHLASLTRLPVIEPCDKEPVLPGCVYTAPANYHMLIGRDDVISLSVDGKVNWSRPSIDVLFESAARAWGNGAVAVLLSGASADGAAGLYAVKASGGRTIVQDPSEAQSAVMPNAAINAGAATEVMKAGDIGKRLMEIFNIL